ncbi:MAG: hypothetical protein GY861_02895 [bacterium]|nr:hypothetical protein [bacterium]
MRELKKILEATNIVTGLEDTEIDEIGLNAVTGYESDDESRADWKERNKKGMDLAMQIVETKNFPIENAANVMYPLISIACIQFASRAYPNLIPGWDIVKGKIIGRDDQGIKAGKASRVSTHMNYQLNDEMEEWVDETDRLLTVLPIPGCCFKETYWSKNLKRNVSTFIPPQDLVMHYMSKSMATVPRITKVYTLYQHEIIERFRSGVFKEFELGTAQATKNEDDEYQVNDHFKPHVFLQQHTWLDLDDDGYPEPYIVNIHYDTKKVVRIVPRFSVGDIYFNESGKVRKITPRKHYTKFSFIPSPDGSIYDWGFGALLGPINHTVNTTINQLLDAGTINNSQSGFIGKQISLGRGRGGGPMRLQLNELTPVKYSGDDLRKNIVMLNEFMKEPSAVLFNLLGFMINAGEKLSSVTELMMGEQSVQNEPATTSLARIEQGLKVFSSIHKRLHRSFGDEFKLLYRLNSEKLNPESYFRITDDPKAQKVGKDDYDASSCDVRPVSSPDEVSNTQKMMKAQLLEGMKGQGLNDAEITRRTIEAMNIPEPERVLEAPPPPPNPELVLKQEETRLKREELDLERFKFEFEMTTRKEEAQDTELELEKKRILNEQERAKLDKINKENDKLVAEKEKAEAEKLKIEMEIAEGINPEGDE